MLGKLTLLHRIGLVCTVFFFNHFLKENRYFIKWINIVPVVPVHLNPAIDSFVTTHSIKFPQFSTRRKSSSGSPSETEDPIIYRRNVESTEQSRSEFLVQLLRSDSVLDPRLPFVLHGFALYPILVRSGII